VKTLVECRRIARAAAIEGGDINPREIWDRKIAAWERKERKEREASRPAAPESNIKIWRDFNDEIDEWGWLVDGDWHTDSEVERMAETCDNPAIARDINAALRDRT
jgi:hypothetical protein